MNDRVVITGLGAITPLGHSAPESWHNIVKGVPGVGLITQFDASELDVQIACEVKNFDPINYMSPKKARRRDRFAQFATVAVKEALTQSGIEITEANADRVGVVISSSAGGMGSFEDAVITLHEKGPRSLSPFSGTMYMSSGAAGLTAIDVGARGPSFSVESACASGGDGIGVAWTLIRAGMMDVGIAGASDASIVATSVGGLNRSGAMSRRRKKDHPYHVPQPFDLNRDGLVMGEGSGILILERESHARARGAEILAELAGYGATGDAFHITAPLENGLGANKAMQRSLQIAGVNLDEVDYINAHGTGTRLNDVTETRAIKSLFGDLAYDIPVSSTKSMTGHMMGVTPAVEAIFSVMAIRENSIPPTIHYQTPDPDCDLDYVPNVARQKEIKVVVSNAFGFGGHNAVLVLREYR
jgi:beta-ketoacyl-acyl-carrier-protein synthase II